MIKARSGGSIEWDVTRRTRAPIHEMCHSAIADFYFSVGISHFRIAFHHVLRDVLGVRSRETKSSNVRRYVQGPLYNLERSSVLFYRGVKRYGFGQRPLDVAIDTVQRGLLKARLGILVTKENMKTCVLFFSASALSSFVCFTFKRHCASPITMLSVFILIKSHPHSVTIVSSRKRDYAE